jgi:hypothetical protein
MFGLTVNLATLLIMLRKKKPSQYKVHERMSQYANV